MAQFYSRLPLIPIGIWPFLSVLKLLYKQTGKEAAMFKAIFRHSILLTTLVGLLVLFYAYVIPGFVVIP